MDTLIQYVEFWAEKQGNKIALIDRNNSWSYKKLKNKISDLQRFFTEYGLKKGDTIGFSGEKSVNLVSVYISLFGLGINVVPLPEKMNVNKKIDETLRISNCDYVIKHDYYNDEFWIDAVNDFLNCEKGKRINIRSKSNESSELIDFDEKTYFNLTSGSTGDPKIVNVKNKKLIFNAKAVNAKYPMLTSDCYTCFFSTDMHPHELFVKPLISGAKCLLINTDELINLDNILRKNNISHMLLTPHTLKSMLKISKDFNSWSSIKNILIGGEFVPLSLRKSCFEKTGRLVTVAWGSTETSGISITLPEEIAFTDESFIGEALPGYEVKVDKETKELLIKSDSCLDSYKNFNGENPLTTDGFYKTGDLAEISEDGLIKLNGRKNSLVKVNGRKIPLNILEIKALKIPELDEVYVMNHIDESLITVFYSADTKYQSKVRVLLKNLLEIHLSDVSYRIVYLEEIPKLENGKTNRDYLENFYKKREYGTELKWKQKQ
ncbi:class I adenylate-forming enzyme family protein [Exiguobacterium sp. ERU656]|uniref:class I adenylate-forming enzyme family protein n=1 Tax=Exiguobacterium sp. ERU656 TaxID=2751217 RepID=UPI001BE70976|nr:class I adenylate-forming enzyme family protein [Exiguobacterium sp. ERU656]